MLYILRGFVESYLILLELPVDQQRGLLVHFLSHSVGHGIVRLQASIETGISVLIVHILLGVSGTGEVKEGEDGQLDQVKINNGETGKPGDTENLLNDVTDVHFRHVLAVGVGNLLLLFSQRRSRVCLIFVVILTK